MIIECPSCQSRYRIREEKLPKGGGNIKCPNCAHVFFVSPDGTPEPAAAPAPAPAPAAPAPAAAAPAAAPATPTPAPEPAAVAPPAAAAFAAAAASSPPPTRDGGGDDDGDEWKLRNAVGLVYDFTDIEQLRRWLAARDSHDGLQASRDGGSSWHALSNFPELSAVEATGRKTVMGMAALTAASGGKSLSEALAAAEAAERKKDASSMPTAESMRERAQARLEQARKARNTGKMAKQEAPASFDMVKAPEPETRGTKLIGILALVVLPLFAIAALQMAGVVDMTSVLNPAPPEPEYEPPLPTTNPLDSNPVVQDRPTVSNEPDPNSQLTPQERELRRVLADAAAAYERGEIPVAIGSLERAAFLDPENLELHCRIADLYDEIGQARQAEEARGRCNPDAPSEGSAASP